LLAGTAFFDAIMQECGVDNVEWLFQDGHVVLQQQGDHPVDSDALLRTQIKTPVARVVGRARQLLQAERVALNVLSRCSSIATNAHRFCMVKEQMQFKGEISATR